MSFRAHCREEFELISYRRDISELVGVALLPISRDVGANDSKIIYIEVATHERCPLLVP